MNTALFFQMCDDAFSSKVHGYAACFDTKVDPNYICPICLLVLRDATQTRCGHRFCEECISRVIGFRSVVQCPVDRTWLVVNSEIFVDEAERREVLSLLTRCENDESGCSWRGELRALQDHESTCSLKLIVCSNECGESFLRKDATFHQDLCPFRKVKCDHCKDVMKFSELEMHDEQCPKKVVACELSCGLKCTRQLLVDHTAVCPQRVVECEHCHVSMVFTDLTKHQLLSCSKILVTCTLCKRQGILREDIQKHVCPETGDCPDVTVKCYFTKMGCTFEDKRRMMYSHYTSFVTMEQHLKLATSYIDTLSTKVSDINQEMAKIKDKQEDIQKRLGHLNLVNP
ncbi:TNF receptor-associated factor 4-like [Gigantopelta aegis]|uniref:TNF receptor-associated factor 4-like n=1 Tax=Gigantopelta aegis TaxID=1735272 RepID=UPI001B88E5E9|nr:TNF receptor-associated factor 4-like [Gigantopelta aegis]